MKTAVFVVALLAVGAARGEDLSAPASLLRFTLAETPTAVRHMMGDEGYQSNLPGATIIEFRDASQDLDDDPVWRFYFQKPGEQLVVVVHNFEKAADVSELFPASDSQRHFFPNEQHPTMTVLVRKLDKDRVIVATLQGRESMLAGQILLSTPARAEILFPFIAPPKK